MRRFGLAVAVLGLVAGVTGSARAGIVLYTDRSSFNAASTGLQTIDFEGLGTPGSFTYKNDTLTTSGVTFTDASSRLYVIDSNAGPGYNFQSGMYLQSNYGADGTLGVALPTNVTAFGADFGEFRADADLTVTLSTGETYTFQPPGARSYTFRGFTSDTAIAGLSFTSTTFAPTLDNVSFGSTNVTVTATTPEPSTLVSAGIACVMGLGYGWRRRRNARLAA